MSYHQALENNAGIETSDNMASENSLHIRHATVMTEDKIQLQAGAESGVLKRTADSTSCSRESSPLLP